MNELNFTVLENNLYLKVPKVVNIENIAVIKNQINQLIESVSFNTLYIDLSNLENYDLTFIQLLFSIYKTITSQLGKKIILVSTVIEERACEKLYLCGFNSFSDPDFFNI